MNDNVTKIANLFVPEVVGPEIITKLVDDIKFTPFAKYRDTLKGTAGDKVKRWKYTYIGDAEEFTEGNDISYGELTQVPTEMGIKKAGRGVKLTDEAVLNSVGDVEGEAVRQIRMAIAQKIDKDCKNALDEIIAQMTVGDGTQTIGTTLIELAQEKWGEDLETDNMTLLIHPKQVKNIRHDPDFIPASEIKAQMMITGSLGQILGCNIVVSNKVTVIDGKYTNYLIKGQPLVIEVKRDIMPERDRDIDKKITKCNADIHYGVYLEEDQNAVKIISKDTEYVAPTYAKTTDTKYVANKEYYSKSGTTYTKLVAGTDYTVGDSISGDVYEKKS